MYSLNNLGGILILVAFLSFIWGMMQCFSGYKIFRFLIVLNGAVLGGLLGYLLTKNAAGAILGAAAGGALIWYVYQVGIFLMGMTLGYLAAAVLYLLFDIMGPYEILVLGPVFGIAGGIFALSWHKFIIVLSTAFYGAFIMAFWLGILFTQSLPEVLDSPGMLIMVTLFLGYLGMLVQYEKLEGYFKEGKTLADLKITREDIHQDRKITPEMMNQNMEEFKTIKDALLKSDKYRLQPNAPSTPWQPSSEKDYQTQKVPAPGQSPVLLTLVQLSGTFSHQRYPVTWRPASAGFEAIVGKSAAGSSPDVNIPEPVVSRKHILLIQKAGQLFIRHLSTSNPTYKNNQPLQPNTDYPLQKGDSLILGDIQFKVE